MSRHLFLRAILGALLLLCLSGRALAVSDQSASTKTDTEQIRDTLNDYLEGTANGEPDRLKRAFHPDFNLYAVTDANTLLVRSGRKYIEDIQPGRKLNRIGRILSIDVDNNAASAKVDIVMPNVRIFTDYFLLLKFEGAWKIVHKSYTSKSLPRKTSKVLFITSNQHTYGSTDINASNHFEEIVIAYDVFRKNGIAVDFVSPKGGAIPLGYIQTSNQTQKAYLYDAEFMKLLQNTFKPGQVDPNDYRAVYYTGGGAAMFGVADNSEIQELAASIYKQGGVISAICHGTAGIVNLKNSDGTFIVANRKITGFPDFFEDTKAEYYRTFPFSIDKAISKQGGNFVYSKTFGDKFHIVDGKLITGQDPSSTTSVARQVVESIGKMNSTFDK